MSPLDPHSKDNNTFRSQAFSEKKSIRSKIDKMNCQWDTCDEKADDLGDHIYYAHLEELRKDLGAFTCKWRGCKHKQVYKYKSHLALHLSDHLNGNESAHTGLGEGWSYMEADTIVCDLSERIACPDQSCKKVTFVGNT